MNDYAGIDVSLEQSSVCMVDGSDKIVWELKVASDPGSLIICDSGGSTCRMCS